MKKFILLAVLFFSIINAKSAQFVLSVQNQVVTGNDVTFDLYIRTTAPADTIFLASSSWGWTYNLVNFTSPSFSVVDGFTTNFISRTGLDVGSLFYTLTANIPTGNIVTGDIAGPDPQTQTTFDQRVARITNQPNYHRIGRYMLSGLNNPTDPVNLAWYLPYCTIWGYYTTAPFNTFELTGTYEIVQPLPAPTLVFPANGAVNLSLIPQMQWNAVSGATSYRLQISTEAGFASTTLDTTVTGTTVNVPSGKLVNNTQYFWRVNASNSGTTSGWSSIWNFRTILATPLLSNPLNGAMNQSITPTMSWGSVTGATNYRIQISTDAGFASTVLDSTLNSTSVIVPPGKLNNSTTYYWRVYAQNFYGNSLWSTTWNFTTFAALAAPNLTAPANNATCIPLTPITDWSDVTGASSYRIQVSTSTGFGTTVLDTTVSISQASIAAGKLSFYTIYYWRVQAINAFTTSSWSATWNFETTIATPVLTSPANGTTNLTLSPTLQYNGTIGLTGYRVQVAFDPGFSGILLDSSLVSPTLTIPSGKLSAGMSYYWRVNASRNACVTPWSTVWSFSTMGLPAAPVLVSPANGAANVILTPTMQWNAVSGAVSYAINISTNSGFNTLVYNTTVAGTSVTLPAGILSMGTTYYWRVYATNAVGSSPWSAVWSFSTYAALAAPVLSIPADGATNIILIPNMQWNAVSGATNYNLQVSTNSGFSTTLVDVTVSGTSYIIPSGVLANNTQYYWRVNASNSNTTSPWSSTWSFTTFALLSAPTLISPANSGVTSSTPTMQWNTVSGATSYRIQISTSGGFGTNAFDTTINVNSVSVPSGKLAGATAYYWRVNASNSNSTSPWSAMWFFWTEPNAPVLVSPANGSTNLVLTPTLQWNAVSGSISYYNVQISDNSGFTATILDTNIYSNTSFSVGSGKLSPGTTYYWRARASGYGVSSWSSVWSFSTLAIPGAPTLIAPVNGAANQSLTPIMQWSTVPSSTGYRLQLSTSNAFGTTVFDTTFNGTSLVVPSGKLIEGTTYYWRAYAQNNSGPGPWSTVWNFATYAPMAAPVLTSPLNNAVNVSLTPSMQWNAVTGASTYRIMIATDAGFTNLIYQDSTITGISVSVPAGLLTNNSLYYWRVNAKNAYTTSPWSASWNFRTILATPVLTAPANGSTGLTLTPLMQWNGVTGATNYRIQIGTDVGFSTLTFDTVITGTTITVPSGKLSAGTTYYWHVYAANTYGNSLYSGAWSFSTLAIPGAPTLIAPVNGAANQSLTPTMQWSTVPSSTGYRIQISTSNAFGSTVFDTTFNGTSVVISSGKLIEGTTYYWRVYAQNNSGPGPWSTIWNFSTYALLSAPTLTAPANNAVNVALTPSMQWSAVTGASTYRIMIATDAAFTNLVYQDSTLTGTSVSVPAGLLTNNSLYYWRVNAKNAYTISPWSASWNFRTILDTPVLTAPANGSTGLTLTPLMQWNGVTGATNYRLQIGTDVGFTAIAFDTVITGTSITVPSGKLSAGTTYYWHVYAANTYGNSVYSTTWNFGTLAIPGAPTLIAPVNGATNQSLTPTMQWSTVPSSVAYRVQISTSNTFGTTVFDTTFNGTSVVVPTGRLVIGTTYYWRAYAQNNSGPGPWSSIWNFTTYTDLPAPVLVTPANASTCISLTPTMDWNDVPNALTYNIQISTSPSFGTTVVDVIVSVSNYTVASGNLAAGATYYWRVSASNSNTTSPWSTVWNFGTILNAPALTAPVNGATNVALTPTMQWNSVTGALNYRLQISANTGFTTTVLDTTVASTSVVVPSGKLSAGVTYYWRVNASQNTCISAYSTVWNFSTINVPLAPVLISPVNGAVNQPLTLSFTWNSVPGFGKDGGEGSLNNPLANTYEIQVSTDSVNFTNPAINVTGLTVTNYTALPGALTNYTKYYWRVRANNGTVIGPWSLVWNFRTILATPVLVTPANGAINVPQAPLLNWNDVTGATSYQVQVSTNAGFGTTVINQSGLTVSQYQVGNNVLSLSTVYYWRVKASAGTDTSFFSGAFSFTTEGKVTVNMTIIPGGFYNSGANLNMKDTIKAYLVDTTGTPHWEDSAKGVVDTVNFTVQFVFNNAQSGSYYIYVYHRNHLPISTAQRQNLSRTAPLAYNFTDNANKAYGGNMIQVSTSPVRWGMIPGDANRDEFVDALDQVIWINTNGLDGYMPADFNGDWFVDGLDQILWITHNGSSSNLPYYITIPQLNPEIIKRIKLEMDKNK